MMKAPKRYEFDGYGYLTNVGQSKYWGVHAYHPPGRKGLAWRIRCDQSGLGKILHIRPNWTITEREGAHIASSFYEKPAAVFGIERIIPSLDGEHEYRVDAQGGVAVFDARFGTSESSSLYMPVTGERGFSQKNVHERQEQIFNQLLFMVENDLGDEKFFRSIESLAGIGRKYSS